MLARRTAILTGVAAATAALASALPSTAEAAAPAPGASLHSSQVQNVDVYRPGTAIVVNQSSQPLTIQSMVTDLGPNTASWQGPSLSVGTVIPAGGEIRVRWLVYFTGSRVDIVYRAPDGSRIKTATSGDFLGGMSYSCSLPSGSLRCASNNPAPSLEQNVVIA